MDAMTRRLRIVHLEDDPLDAELIRSQLGRSGLAFDVLRAIGRDDFLTALQSPDCCDLILSDFSLPGFDGLSALALAREHCPEVPFLFVSGAIGEERAIETLRNGATDYVLKQRLERLVPSVVRALRESEERAQRRRLENELRQRAEALAEAHRNKDAFLAVLSHELRNPLGPIRNALQVLRIHGPTDPILVQSREIIGRQVQTLTQLVDDLLDITRVARGKVQLRTQRCEASALVQRAVEGARSAIQKRCHELTVVIADEPVWLDADPVRIQQILVNLLTNAAKYTDPGGHIHLSVRPEEDRAVFRVRDNGIGIDAKLRAHIFDLYIQAEHALDRSQGGLGIGLSLVRHLVELHGGTIQVVSDGPGKGSEFIVCLPRATNGSSTSVSCKDGETSEVTRSSAGQRVLIVDDNRDGAESLAIMLRLWGHNVSVAFDGPTALLAALQHSPEFVILDIGLPGMDGYDVAQELRRQPGGDARVLVALTGYGQEEDRRRALEAGFDHHLVKPVNPDQLQTLLAPASSPLCRR
jgi:signal transduction histidine kinase